MNKEIKKLKKNYQNAVMAYIDFFCTKQEMDYEFINFDLVLVADMYLRLDEIIYDVDNEVPAGKIIEYWDYSYERYINNENPENEKLTIVNYASFCKGMR